MLRSVALLGVLAATSWAQSFNGIDVGFPEAWDGDRYRELYCPSKGIPKFLDGFFLCQLSAAYGSPSAPPGQRLNHMIDAIGAVGAFHITNGQVSFSAQYYPSRPYKIWEFYDRNMSKSSVPWAGWSDYNLTAMARWEQIPPNPDSARFHPNLDFWKIGKRIVAGTEAPYWVGYEFDVKSLNKFKLFPFVEDNDVFGEPRGVASLIPISMAIHERNDADGVLWGSFSAMNFQEQRFYQGVFTVDPNGVRRVLALYDYGAWDATACGKDDEYIGDKTQLPGYIHSITSTENYLILPITSLLINPCKFKEPPMTNVRSAIQNGGLWGMDYYDMVPMRFLIFNKKTKEWATSKPLEVFPSMFVTHQLNAFEQPDGSLVADMVVYDSHDPYVKYFYTDFLTSQLYPSTARLLRFTLDPKQQRVMYNYLIAKETIAADFAQTNHAFEGRPYQWAYLVQHPFAARNAIIKINVDDPTGARNMEFRADSDVVLHEPWFVAPKESTREDDGVLLIKALDVAENKGMLLVVDATTMTEVGRAYVPISIPFGFHNRFYSKRELGLPDGFQFTQQLTNGKHQFRPATLDLVLDGNESTTTSTERPAPRVETTQEIRRVTPTTTATTTTSTTTTTTAATTTTTTPTTTTTTTPKTIMEEQRQKPVVPRWWPLHPSDANGGANSNGPTPLTQVNNNVPWWQKVEKMRGRPVVAAMTSTKRPTTLDGDAQPPSSIVPLAVTMTTMTTDEEDKDTSAFRALYERTLEALCRWLPRVFTSISSSLCKEQGRQAVRWVAPIASSYADRLRLSRTQRALASTTSAVIRPEFKTHTSPNDDDAAAAAAQPVPNWFDERAWTHRQ